MLVIFFSVYKWRRASPKRQWADLLAQTAEAIYFPSQKRKMNRGNVRGRRQISAGEMLSLFVVFPRLVCAFVCVGGWVCVIVLVLASTVSIWCIDACGHLTSHWTSPSSFGGNCPFHLQLIRHCSWYSSYAAWWPKQDVHTGK